MADGLLIYGIVAAYVAFMVFVVALSLRPGEAGFLATIIRPAIIAAALPPVWIIIQLLPIPISGVEHPVWLSAQTALGTTLLGGISIDRGASLISLCRYFSAAGIFFVATAVCIDRLRAETMLFWLAGVTTLLALLLIVHDLGGYIFLGELSSVGRRASVTAAATFGTVLTATLADYAFERYETRRNRADFSIYLLVTTVLTAFGGFVVCWIAIAFFTSKAAIFAALCGVGTFALIVGFRRLGIGPRVGLFVAAVAIAVPLSVIAKSLLAAAPDLTIRFDTLAAQPLLALTQRIIGDTSWTGSGAGTFASLLPIYHDTGNTLAASVAPTTAASFLIELGRPALWIIVIGAVVGIAWLIHGALERGRDSFFAAAGAACGITLLIEGFFDASLAGTATLVIAASVLGLGLSQSVSRTTR